MDSTGLYEAFRSEVADEARPYLWSDADVWRYANDAYRMFCRLTGGVADFLSDACAVDIVAGEATSEISPSILRVMSATLRSSKRPIKIINEADMGKMQLCDYGHIKALTLDDRPGSISYMIQGMKRGTVRWLMVPEADDVADLHIYRMPLNTITDLGQELTDVQEDHHIHLLHWMKHLAYMKQDAETFNAKASADNKEAFEAYCRFVKAEWERYKHKPRSVVYGGI